MAKHLARLLERRTELDERPNFSPGASHHVFDIISHASEHHYLHQFHVKNELKSLLYQYSLDY